MSAAIQIHAPETEVRVAMRFIGAQARAATRVLANASAEQKNRALTTAARFLRERLSDILAANACDLADGKAKGLTPAFLDRLALDESRIESIARGLEDVASLPDPVGRVLATSPARTAWSSSGWRRRLASSASFTRAGRTSPRMRAPFA